MCMHSFFVLTLISERSLFLTFVTLIATCYRYKIVDSSCIVRLKWCLPDDNLSRPVSTQSNIMWSILHVKLDLGSITFTLLCHSVPDLQLDWYVNARFKYCPWMDVLVWEGG